MTEQEVFDKVVAHLRKQGKRSVNPSSGTCMYRSGEGLQCAAGCLIKDEFYSPELEGFGARSTKVMKALEQSGVVLHGSLVIRGLQVIHDDFEPSVWEEKFSNCAARYALTYSPPEVDKV